MFALLYFLCSTKTSFCPVFMMPNDRKQQFGCYFCFDREKELDAKKRAKEEAARLPLVQVRQNRSVSVRLLAWVQRFNQHKSTRSFHKKKKKTERCSGWWGASSTHKQSWSSFSRALCSLLILSTSENRLNHSIRAVN